MQQKCVVWDVPNGREYCLSVDDNAPIVRVKQRVSQLTGAPTDYIRLSRNGREIGDEQHLNDLNSSSSSSFLSSLVWGVDLSQQQRDASSPLRLEMDYSLDGGCISEGYVCCDCCGLTGVCRPCECIDRCFCFFAGCDLADCNAIQCFCWRCYCCITPEQRDRATS